MIRLTYITKCTIIFGLLFQSLEARQPGVAKSVNMGPTGIRVLITKEQPNYFKVKEINADSPADGLLNADDLIVGANGKIMDVSQNFHFFVSQAGPVQEMAKLIEDSQAKDGKLELIVWPGGDSAKQKTVMIKIDVLGRFSPTFPYDCPRSDLMLKKLRDHIVDLSENDQHFRKLPHAYTACILSLMGTKDPKYEKVVKGFFKSYYDKRYDAANGRSYGGRMATWWNINDSVLLGEYYLLTGDEKLEPVMESLANCIKSSIFPIDGGMPHMPYAAFERRREAGIKRKGYISMSAPSTVAMLGMSLFKEAGLPHAGSSYERIHAAILSTVDKHGSIGYYAKKWNSEIILLTDQDGAPKPNPLGVGFECEEGMKAIGKFTIVNSKKRNTRWLVDEADTNRVYTLAGNRRLVVRQMTPEEPSKPMELADGVTHDIGRSGAAALAHSIGNEGNESWGYLSNMMAKGCAKSPSQLLAGHASAHTHVMWGSLGAALADPNEFRKYMDGIKWWLIMAQRHDGSYDKHYGRTDGVHGAENLPTGSAAIIFAIKDKALRITGRPASGKAGSRKSSSAQPKARQAREISAKKKELLNDYLYKKLCELGHQKELIELPVPMSKAIFE